MQNVYSKKSIIIGFYTETIISVPVLLSIKKQHKSIPATTFVGGIKNFATQDNTYEKWVLSRPGQAEYVAGLKEITGTGKSSQNPRKCLRSSEINKYEMYVQRVKDILLEEFIIRFQTKWPDQSFS